MSTRFKWIALIFACLLLGGIIVIQFLPKPKLSFTERQELTETVKRINANLPKEMGTIGRIDKVSLRNDTLIYHYSIYGGDISQFYKENYKEIRELQMYVFLIMNGQSNMGNAFSKLLDSKGMSVVFERKLPNGDIFRLKYEGKELLQFAETLKLNPTEALLDLIDTHIKLTNLSLPLTGKETPLQTIPTIAISQTMASDERLIQIKREDNNIIFVIESGESASNIEAIRDYAQNPLFSKTFLEETVQDADFREFISLFAIARTDFTYRIKNKEASDSVDIFIPHSIINELCYNSNLLN